MAAFQLTRLFIPICTRHAGTLIGETPQLRRYPRQTTQGTQAFHGIRRALLNLGKHITPYKRFLSY